MNKIGTEFYLVSYSTSLFLCLLFYLFPTLTCLACQMHSCILNILNSLRATPFIYNQVCKRYVRNVCKLLPLYARHAAYKTMHTSHIVTTLLTLEQPHNILLTHKLLGFMSFINLVMIHHYQLLHVTSYLWYLLLCWFKNYRKIYWFYATLKFI